MSDTNRALTSAALARLEGLAAETVLGVLIARLDRLHPGLAQDIEGDLEARWAEMFRSAPEAERETMLAVLRKGGAKIMASARKRSSDPDKI